MDDGCKVHRISVARPRKKTFCTNLRVPGPMLRCEERQDVLCQLRCDGSEPSDDLVMIYGYQGGEDGDEEEGDVVP